MYLQRVGGKGRGIKVEIRFMTNSQCPCPVVVDRRQASSHLGLRRAKRGRLGEVDVVQRVDGLVGSSVLELGHHLKIFQPAVLVTVDGQGQLFH